MNLAARFDLLTIPPLILSVRDHCLQESFDFPKDPSDDGPTAAHDGENVVVDEHWYPWLPSAAQVRSGLPLSDVWTTCAFFSVIDDFCRWCL